MQYKVTLSADAIVSATVIVEAFNEEEAKRRAIDKGLDDAQWNVDSLHEEPTVFNVEPA